MRKLFYGLILFINSCTPAIADTITSGVGLLKPTPGLVDTTRSWADKINSNFDIIASSLSNIPNSVSGTAVALGTQTIANSTGVWVNGVLVSSIIYTGAGQSASFNGSTVTVTITGGGGGGGDVSGTTTTRLNNLDASTATLTVRLGNLDSSTATLNARTNNLDIATNSIQSQLYTIVSTNLPQNLVLSTFQATSRILIGTSNPLGFILTITSAGNYSQGLVLITTNTAGIPNSFGLINHQFAIYPSSIIAFLTNGFTIAGSSADSNGILNSYLNVGSTGSAANLSWLNVGPPSSIGDNSTNPSFTPLIYAHKNGRPYIYVKNEAGGVNSIAFWGQDVGNIYFGSESNHQLQLVTNNATRITIPAAGGLIVKSTDLFVGTGGLVAIGTTTPRAMLHLALMNGATTDMRFVRFSSGDTIIYEVTPSSWAWYGGLSSTWTVLAGSVSLPNASLQDAVLINSPATAGAYTSANITINAQGIITAAANGTGGGGGGGGSIVVQQGAGTYSGAISSMTATNDVVFDIRNGSVNVKVDLSTLNIRANNTDLSTAALQNQILLLSTSSLSGGGGGVKSLYLRSIFDTSNASSYFLMQTTPATTSEVTKTAAITAAAGLVMLSSHSTLPGGMGASVVTLPTGFWQFVMYAGIDSIVNQTDLICNLSTMSKTGTNKFQFLAATITNVNTLTPTQFTAETVLTSDVTISTDDRVVLDIYARTSSALSRTVTLALEGTARVSRLGTTVERQPTFLALNDTPASYNGKSGQFPQVNPGETALIFNTIDTMTAITAISTTGAEIRNYEASNNASTGTFNTNIGTTGVFGLNTFAAVQSTYLAAIGTGTALTNYQAAVNISTSIQLSQHYVIVSTNLAPTITITNLISSSITAHTEVEFPVSAAAIAPNISSPCMPTVQIFESATNRINYDGIGFSSFTGVNYGHFNHSLPKGWNASTVTFHVVWTSTSAGTAGQTVVWGMQALAITSGTTIDAAYGSTRTVTSSVLGTANQLFRSTEALTMTVGGSPAQGNETQIVWNIFRDKTDARDNFQGQANLVEIRIRYTKEYLTDK